MKRAVRSKLGLQAVLAMGLVLLALGLTGGLVQTAFHRFEDMARESARIIFGQAAREGNHRVAELVARAERLVDVHSRAADAAGGAQRLREAPAKLLAELRNDAQLYACYLALDDGSFVQAIAVRGQPRLVQALGAPAGTAQALRVIESPAPGQPRTERWRYFDATGRLLAEAQRGAGYDPRERPWYRAAIAQAGTVLGSPYLFESTGQLGLTVARRFEGGGGVVGADLDLQRLDEFFAGLASTPRSVTLLVDPDNRLIAWGGGVEAKPAGRLAALMPLEETGNAQLAYLAGWRPEAGDAQGDPVRVTELDGEAYVLAQSSIAPMDGVRYRVAAYAPLSEFGGFILAARNQMLLFALLFLAVVLPLAIVGSGRVVSGLRALVQDAQRIRRMDFAETPPVRSRVREIDQLGESQAAMKHAIRTGTEALHDTQAQLQHLVATGLELSRERDRMALLRSILRAATELTHCDAGTLYIVTEQRTLRFALRTRDDALPSFEIPLYDAAGAENLHFVSTYVALRNEPVAVDDVYTETRFDLSGTRRFDAETGYHTGSMLAVPLAPREGEVIGVLQLMNAKAPEDGRVVPFGAETTRFVSALAAQAAVALDNHQLVEAQQTLMDALVQLIAGAIDAKSAYTGGHCERVPELAIMLAEAASAEQSGPLAGFAFRTADEWREFRIGAWLHDCGKVTTPEYVVDKATKLETIHDRIHEVRTRFEVLLRDARIASLEARLAGQDAAEADRAYAARHAELVEDFAFVAECNLGGEFMAPERVARLHRIGEQGWLRYFDDRLGIAHEQLARLQTFPAPPLPAPETLLADKPQHIVPRPPEKALDSRHGFRVKVPEHLYHFGELHNLSIGRGTLTEEERFKINEHIIQTIVMLDALPLPRNMRRVPEYAGTHHETMAGTGYPRRLDASQLSVPARIMAVADIFEALTAADRPYKKAKTLSESIRILARFRDDRHIDADVFALFLRSGVYRRYAERYLRPDQIDEVDVEAFLAPAAARA